VAAVRPGCARRSTLLAAALIALIAPPAAAEPERTPAVAADPKRPPPAAAEPEREMDPEARELYDLGMAHYRARGFSEAVRVFESAYALDPQREILFALAQATRLSGDCPSAVPLYERVLASHPPARQAEATRIALARCHERAAIEAAAAKRASAPDPKLVLGRAPPLAPPVSVTARPSPPLPAWYRDPATAALAAAAVVSLGTGAGLLVASHLADREHRDAPWYGRDDERWSAANNRQRWSAAAFATAAILGAGAGARRLWLRWSAGRGQASVSLGAGF
jgi:hypothetical protein